jgi:hypothetical protein
LKKPYQIEKQSALRQFRCNAGGSSAPIQFALPLSEVVKLAQQGLMSLALAAFTQVAEHLMSWDVEELVGAKNQPQPDRDKVRWGKQAGYCVVGGQKVPLQRPRVRDRQQREVPLGSYEMLQRASLMEEAVWQKIMHGLTTRRYSDVTREIEQAYGIEKSTVSEHFIEASRQRLQKLETRPLSEYCICALLIDGTWYLRPADRWHLLCRSAGDCGTGHNAAGQQSSLRAATRSNRKQHSGQATVGGPQRTRRGL